ncbi:MAG: hypothetical protein PWR14_795 [Thermosediminibacterales bacterium]|nr:hypothetical protein [Thermosediminibacterales bacterium]
MGYYSDVYFATTKEGFDFLFKEKVLREELFPYTNSIKYNTKDNCVLVCWENIKWYDFDPESPEYIFVNALTILKEKDIPFHYVRLGENFGDIDERSYKAYETNFPDIYPVQKIEIYPETWNGEKIKI